jgi:hypothetical protein
MTFLLLPVSGGYWSIVTFGGYYIFFLAQLFFCLGLFIKLLNTGNSHKFPFVVFSLFTLLSLVLGVQGIRSPLAVQLPLFLSCIYFALISKKPKKQWLIFLGSYSLFLCIIGFGINYLLHFKYNFHSFENMLFENLFLNFLPKLGQCLVCLADFFGLSAGNSLLSARGILSVFAIIGAGILFFAAFKIFRVMFINKTKSYADKDFLPVFFIISCLLNMFVFIVVDEPVTSRYFIPFMVLYIPLLCLCFENAEQKDNHLKRVIIIAVSVLFIAGQSILNFQSMAKENTTRERDGYIQYLLDNELNYGFATFWNANVTTEITNGKIEIVGLEQDGLNSAAEKFRIHPWLLPKYFYNPEYHDGPSFLLLSHEQWDIAKSTQRKFAQNMPDYEDNNFIVLQFPSDDIIYSEVLDK